MALYREYSRPGYEKSQSKTISFIKQTYQLFAASLFAGAVGVYLTLPYVDTIASNFILLSILEFGLLFGLFFVKNKPGINLIVMFAFVFMTGVTAAPLLSSVLTISGGATIIGNAFLMTSVIVGGMSMIAVKSTKDFTGFAKPMFISILVIFAFSLINVFLLHNPIISIVISSVIVLIFSFMVIIDTQNLINGSYETPIEGAISLYIDFLNIFLSLVRLLGFFGDND